MSGSLPPFGAFAAAFFAKAHPELAAMLDAGASALASDVYLYRFDSTLSAHFVKETIDVIARAIADASGKSVAEARRLFLRSAERAARQYFSHGWDNVLEFSVANTPALSAVRRRQRKFWSVAECVEVGPATVLHVNSVSLEALLESSRLPVAVKIYADYCSDCKAMAPAFEEAARRMSGYALFAAIDGPRSPEFKDMHQVSVYPTVMCFFQGGQDVRFYPRSAEVSVENFVAFAAGEDIHVGNANGGTGSSITDSPPVKHGRREKGLRRAAAARRELGQQWASMLERQGIDELDALVRDRDLLLHSRIDDAIECGGTSCDVQLQRAHGSSLDEPPPMCILLGGGMGAGKTTAVSAVSRTPFWNQHGNNIVIVEADAFKQTDPFFHVLRSVTASASRIVHPDSIAAAEELFLQAVNKRRDVVFDGTLSWFEYAKQTVAMLRDTDYLYERGPGYKREADGSTTELYWVQTQKRENPVPPYRVELVACTVDAEVAVMRGIVRKISTGRGVPVCDQLQSHALFSRHFERYVDLLDSVYLFDMSIGDDVNVSLKADDGQRAESQLIAIKPGVLFSGGDKKQKVDGFFVQNYDAYGRFLRKRMLNKLASSVDSLYLRSLSPR